jgi:hypothetical protein
MILNSFVDPFVSYYCSLEIKLEKLPLLSMPTGFLQLVRKIKILGRTCLNQMPRGIKIKAQINTNSNMSDNANELHPII